MMRALTVTSSTFFIKNEWIRNAICEILATFIFGLFVKGSSVMDIVDSAGGPIAVNLAISIGLTLGIYFGGNASGAWVNPGVALSMCLTGRLKWKKYPMYVGCHLIGAFLACAVTYGLFSRAIDDREGGMRRVFGENSTGRGFASFPDPEKTTTGIAFAEVLVAHALLVGSTLAILDPRNMNPGLGLAPLPIGLSVFSICSAFSYSGGCAINAAMDFSGRVWLACVGYDYPFSHFDYWFWASPVATTLGSIAIVLIYQLTVACQFPVDEFDLSENVQMKEKQNYSNNEGYEPNEQSI